ncbi:MAG: hypothetical protein AAGN35_05615 [Bacteroidota bacterium]
MKINIAALTLLISLGLFSQGKSQYQLYLGLDVGGNAHFQEIVEKDVGVRAAPAYISQTIMGSLGVRLSEKDYYLTLRFSSFNHFYRFRLPGDHTVWSGSLVYVNHLTVALARHLPLFASRFFLAPELGGNVSLINGGASSGQVGLPGQNLRFGTATLPVDNRLNFSLLTGLTAGFKFRSGMILSARIAYVQGFREAVRGDAWYQFSGSAPVPFTFFSRGTHLPITLGVAYPISRIWQGKITPD